MRWLLLSLTFCAVARPAVEYDRSLPQVAFAAAEIERAGSTRVGIVLAAGPDASARAATGLGVEPLRATAPQSYAIRRTRSTIAVLGTDAAGTMYGGLDVAEAIRLGALSKLRDSVHSPRIEQRGIKFNIPLDARTPSYSDAGDDAQQNIPEVWSLDFWREFLDEMARHRFNVLSLWNLHPFPSMVKVPEYPGVALDDVKRTTLPFDATFSTGGTDMYRPAMAAHLETVKRMTIDDKIRFWRAVMQHAHDRGIDVYLFTWNLFVWGADGKYGITWDQDNPKTIDYFRASVRETVLAYPLLAGIGITAGEHMQNRKDEFAKEKWLWKTYGEGILDAKKREPARRVRLIHRFHQTGMSEILDAWKGYPDTFDFSFKYSIAHMYSIPDPPFLKEALPDLSPKLRTWLTVRDDDVYSFRWGDAAYARAYIRNIPGPEKVAGFYMGPDGTVWARDFLSKDSGREPQLIIHKRWYSFMLWGRLSYDPDLEDALLERTVAQRFPEAPAPRLMRAWAAASQVFPLITRFFWGDIDVRWFPEACLHHSKTDGFYTVADFARGSAMPGSGVLDIVEWRRRKLAGRPMDGTTPLDIADQLQSRATLALEALPGLRARQGNQQELRLTLGDIEAMAHLGNYYAEKIRAASALALFDQSSQSADRDAAVRHCQSAVEHWARYSAAYSRQYRQPRLYTREGVVDIPRLLEKTRNDAAIASSWKPGSIPDRKPKPPSDNPFRK